ncbi:hypothetical protein IQ269_16680 [Tychonema sp. LEGE 07199]|nr:MULTISPECIES: hypothetical protein [unclassified Tychonema]MBE9122391.1 hypothetical protein [Tychonema sp. LEGE 07199]MBE9134451.1 hypothetical protein [Tychonema sp. LEGE 07196]
MSSIFLWDGLEGRFLWDGLLARPNYFCKKSNEKKLFGFLSYNCCTDRL